MTQPPSPDQPQPPNAAPAAPAAADPYAPPPPQPLWSDPQAQAYAAPAPPAQPGFVPPQFASAPPNPYEGARDPYAAALPPAYPYGYPPQPAYQPYAGTPPGAPPPYGAPQPYGYQAYPPAFEPPPREPIVPAGLPPLKEPSEKRPSGWNRYSAGLLGIVLVAVVIFAWPQFRARSTERSVRPLVQALSQRDAGARCPRYITAVLDNVASVSIDGNGRIADRTDLTGPICSGLHHYYAGNGNAELACLTNGQPCTVEARRSIVSLSVVAHESMHLRGQLDEGRAECESMGESQTLSSALGISLEQARLISWLHYAAMNPTLPDRYQVSPENCTFVAELLADPPGTPQVRETLRVEVHNTLLDMTT